jgi:hypothetical protein
MLTEIVDLIPTGPVASGTSPVLLVADTKNMWRLAEIVQM